MLKTLFVWFAIMFLKKFGRTVDKKELSRFKKVYNQHSTVRIERRIARPVPVRAKVTYNRYAPNNKYASRKRGPERVALYNKNGSVVRLNLGLENRKYNAI